MSEETAKQFVERIFSGQAFGKALRFSEDANRLRTLALRGAETQCGDCCGMPADEYERLSAGFRRQSAEIKRLLAVIEKLVTAIDARDEWEENNPHGSMKKSSDYGCAVDLALDSARVALTALGEPTP